MVELERSFDTLAASRKLRGTGMPKRQAEATAEVVADAVKGLVTCEYLDLQLENTEARMNARFERVDARFEQMDARFDKLDVRFKIGDDRLETLGTSIQDTAESLEIRLEAKQARGELRLVASQLLVSGLLFTMLMYFG